MSTSTISTSITSTVTLGSASYLSPLTITSTGDVAPSAYGAIGVYGSTTFGLLTLINDGTIKGSNGTVVNNFGQISGIGVELVSGYVINNGIITGGVGYSGAEFPVGSGPGGAGGAGVSQTYGTLTNGSTGIITGGAGGLGVYNTTFCDAGKGGNGVDLTSATLINSGGITGGIGGNGPHGYFTSPPQQGSDAAGHGGIGVNLVSATLTNASTGQITGGAGGIGGAGAAYQFAQPGGAGGDGVDLTSSAAMNAGSITGGAGGAGGYSSGRDGGNGAGGGFGAKLTLSTLTNSNNITGGTGGVGGYAYRAGVGGAGGAGVDQISGTLTNTGSITGGNGGTGGNSFRFEGSGGGGGAGVDQLSGTLTNTGSITGGIGGNGGPTKLSAPSVAVSYGYGGAGGSGVLLQAGIVNNSGNISGARGGYSGQSSTTTTQFVGTQQTGGAGGQGVSQYGGTLNNSGTITGGIGVTSTLAGSRAGRQGVGGNGVVINGGVVYNSGKIQGGSGLFDIFHYGIGGNGVLLNGGTVINAGTIASASTGYAVNFGTVAGTLVVDQGAVFSGLVVANATVADVLEFGSGSVAGTVTGVGTEFRNFNDFSFASGAWFDVQGTYTAFDSKQLISGFAHGDTLVLDGFAANPGAIAVAQVGPMTELELITGASTIVLDFGGTYALSDFTVTDSTVGTTISLVNGVTCYVTGTQIRTTRGDVAVEDLEIGDLVPTLHGGVKPIKWIGQRGYDGRFIAGNKIALPICIKAHAIADGVPARDLWVSPGHAICIGGNLIHASRLVNGVSIIQAEAVETVTYYHIELESHEVIFAENCPAETFMDEHFRRQFQNAGTFEALYPGEIAPSFSCLPLLKQGFVLDGIQSRLMLRAGIEPKPASGHMHGYLDVAGPASCAGWAQDKAAPETPVVLNVLCDDRVVGRVIANLFREDLRAAGYGNGCCGFEFMIPPEITGNISVRSVLSQTPLEATERARALAA